MTGIYYIIHQQKNSGGYSFSDGIIKIWNDVYVNSIKYHENLDQWKISKICMFENCYKLSREILITETFKVNVQRDSFLLFFLYPWRIVRVNLTGLWLRSKQDFILLSALFLRCGQPWKILWITTKNSWFSEMVIWCNEKVPLPEISSLSKRKQPSNKQIFPPVIES